MDYSGDGYKEYDVFFVSVLFPLKEKITLIIIIIIFMII